VKWEELAVIDPEILIGNRYQILEFVGGGGMAEVYKVLDTSLERIAALKIITSNQSNSEKQQEYLKRFNREAKILAKLKHPHIVGVWDYGEYEGDPYFVMEYFPGGTLDQKMEKPIPWQEAVQILLPIAEALSYAHQQGIVHRDIKPSNILLNESGELILSDFGIARPLEVIDNLKTGDGDLLGTLEYIAPEQISNPQNLDGRADIYSLGVLLYEMVTGRKPFESDAKAPLSVLLNKVLDPVPDPKIFNPFLSNNIINILIKSLAAKSEDRYKNMDDFLLVLENLIEANDKKQETLWKTLQRGWFILANIRRINGVIKLAFLLVLAFIVYVVLQGLQSPFTLFGSTSTPTTTLTPSATITPTTYATLTLTATPTNIPTPDVNLPIEIIVPSGGTMRLVPAGDFTMGSNVDSALAECIENRGDDNCQTISFLDEEPVHTIFLKDFYMDVYEVTNALYKRCVDADECQPPKEIQSYTRPSYYDNPSFDDYPVIYVNWNMAKIYCEWRGARLPTEAEWEKAARGTDGRTYPWGEDLDCEQSNYGQNITGACEGDTTSVGSYENGQSFFGLFDMAGNVSEWVADWYQSDYYATLDNNIVDPQGPNSGVARVTRGGSWYFDDGDVRSANRNGFGIATYNDYIGFRCAKDP
jgi:serine/threonine-protein kinase